MDPALLLVGQVVAKSTYYQLWLFLGGRVVATVTHALAASRLDCRNMLCVRQPLKLTNQKLQLVHGY